MIGTGGAAAGYGGVYQLQQNDTGYFAYTDQIKPFGLDEAWLDVTGSAGPYGSAMEVAQEINRRIKFGLGIAASIGVEDNKITAKLVGLEMLLQILTFFGTI